MRCVLIESVCSRHAQRSEATAHTGFVEETPQLVLHVGLPLFQILLLGPATSKHSRRSRHTEKGTALYVTVKTTDV